MLDGDGQALLRVHLQLEHVLVLGAGGVVSLAVVLLELEAHGEGELLLGVGRLGQAALRGHSLLPGDAAECGGEAVQDLSHLATEGIDTS